MNCADIKIVGGSQLQGPLQGPPLKIFNLPGYPEYTPQSSDSGPNSTDFLHPDGVTQSPSNFQAIAAPPAAMTPPPSLQQPILSVSQYRSPSSLPGFLQISRLPIEFTSMIPLQQELASSQPSSPLIQFTPSENAYATSYDEDIQVIRRY